MARNRSFVIETVMRAVDRLSGPLDRATSRQIRNAGDIEDRFLRMGRVVLRGFSRMAVGLGRFTSHAVNAGKKIGGIGLGFAKWGTASAVGLGAGVTLLNHSTTSAERMAKAMQLNVDMVEAFAGALNGTEFNMENIIDLAEEMTNKIGESKKTGLTEALKGGLKTLDLKYKEVKNLTPEQQFTKFFDVALRMKDRQAGASGLDQIMSGEANKIFGVLASRGVKSVGELTKAYKTSNFQTEESRKGAKEFTDQLSNLTTVFETVSKFAAGILGERLAPRFVELQKYLEANKGIIQKKVTETVDYLIEKLPLAFEGIKSAFEYLIENGPKIAAVLDSVVDFLGSVIKIFNVTFGTVGRFLGETAAKLNLGEFALPQLPNALPPSLEANPLSYNVQSPQERISRSIQESSSTSTSKMQIELNNRSNTVATVKGRTPDGFRMMQTGAFA